MLSVIIPTRNRSDLLQLALQSLQSQTLSADMFEVLVIDNGSTDETKQVVDSFVKNIPNLRYFYEETPGLHVGRHKGLKEAKADILVYADDDIEAFPTWLEGIAEAFKDKDVALVGGKNLPKFETEPPDWILQMWEKDQAGNRILGYLSILDLGDEIKTINPYHVFGCNFAIRKSVLLEAGGFHPDSMPMELIRYRGDGETSLSKKILNSEYNTIYNPAASVYHLVSAERMTKDYVRWRSYIQGISDSYTDIRRSQGIRLQGEVIALIKHIIKRVRHLNRPLRRMISDSYLEGYHYHRQETKKDPQLLAWVLKNNYM